MNILQLPDGSTVPALGLGTWHLGESGDRRAREVAALRLALEIGYRVIDTAEMYGEGGAEQVVGQALAEALRCGALRRDELFVVSKVYPHNASRVGVKAACERSLKRLGLDHIDLYLLHWPGPHPLHETVAGFEALQAEGRIGHWGVSNFDTDDMEDLTAVPGGARCAANQVYYSPSTRGAEFDLLPWQRARSMPLMAYCPLDQGDLAQDKVLQAIAERHGATASQVALAWLIGRGGVMPIPKALSEPHLRANFAAAGLALTTADLAEIDAHFPPPRRKHALAMR
jgi:diketogulonate reductase-like aldo/keto reductase